MMKFMQVFMSLLMMLSVSSCGIKSAKELMPDAFTKSEETAEVDTGSCDLKAEALAKILHENIEEELKCLQVNLNLFVEYVETDRPGFLSYEKLTSFILSNMQNVDQGSVNALGGVFDLSSLMLGDDRNYIKKENIPLLTDLLVDINKTFVTGQIVKLFTTEDRVSFSEHNLRKTRVYKAFRELAKVFGKYYVPNTKSVGLLDFFMRFEKIGKPQIIGNIKTLLFLKKGIIGGNADVLTGAELKRTADLFPAFSKVVFDFMKIPNTDAKGFEDQEILKLFRENILTAKQHFYYADQPEEVIFNFTDVEKFIARFFPDMSHYLSYKESILKIKEAFFKTRSEDFLAAEINILLDDILYKLFDKGVHFYQYYNENKEILNSTIPVEYNFQLITFVDFIKEQQYMLDFNRIVQHYRFYMGDKYLPFFDFPYKRNARGLFEVLVYEDIVRRFFKGFGSEDKAVVGGYAMSMEQLEIAMIELTEVFEGEGFIVPGRVAGTAETITLLTSLFFAQSNGDNKIEIPELTEFIISMLSSLNISSDMFAMIPNVCEVDAKGRFSGECFRKSFRQVLEIEKQGNSFKEYNPNLSAYVDTLSDENLDTYLTRIATFSRTCPYFDDGVERKMNETDGLVTWAGILAIEQSMIRFDGDKNGIMSPKELKNAFSIYRSAIEGMIPVDFLKPKAEKFFQYMIKYEKVPDIPKVENLATLWKAGKEVVHLLNFLYITRSSKRKADADRMTFAAVLKIIAENSPAELELREKDPTFCERMRDGE